MSVIASVSPYRPLSLNRSLVSLIITNQPASSYQNEAWPVVIFVGIGDRLIHREVRHLSIFQSIIVCEC